MDDSAVLLASNAAQCATEQWQRQVDTAGEALTRPLAAAVSSGCSKDRPTWLCAAKLYTSSGQMSLQDKYLLLRL